MKLEKPTSLFSAENEKSNTISSNVSNKNIVADLMNFGLDKFEAILYLELLRTGPITVGNLAVKMDEDRGKMYRTIEKLRNEGLVTTSFSNPVVCSPVDPRNAFHVIIEKKYDELQTMKKLSEKVISEFKMINNCVINQEITSFSVLQDRAIIHNRIGKILQDSENGTIYLVTTTSDLIKMYYTSIPEKLQLAKKNGTIVKILTNPEQNKTILNTIKKLYTTEIRTADLPSSGRMLVEKERQIIMSGKTGDNSSSDTSVHTNSLDIVQNMFTLCEHLWRHSKTLEVLAC